MKNWIWVILAIVILIGVIYVVNQCSQPDLPTEVPPNDTLYVYGDTLWLPSDTVWTVKWKKIPAVTIVDTAGVATKSITKDTLLVMDKDSIKVEATAEYNLSEDTFDMGIDVDYRKYESFRIDTVKTTKYVVRKIEVPQPFYDTFNFGFGVAAILAIIAVVVFK
jgi:hypothetical protein